MKNLSPLLLVAFILTLTASGFSQRIFIGRVVEVIDGKTFVLEVDSGKITGTLQYIEVPEPEQPLSRIVRDHLQKLVFGKTVEFFPSGLTSKAAVGKMYLNGVDMGQQLVRDGAAWHLPIDRSGQEPAESNVYDNNQTLAKAEKRGIWSIANLTPAWEFRAERDRSYGTSEFVSTATTAVKESKNYRYTKNDPDMWIDVGGEALAQKNPIGLMFYGYDPNKKIRNISTPSIAQTIASGEKRLEVELRIVYFQGEQLSRVPNNAFVLGMLATSREHNFAKENTIKFVADGQEIVIDGGQLFWRESAASVQELVQYKVSRSALMKIANAKYLTVKIGRYNGTVSPEVRDTVLKLIEVTS
jgi:micrococcal nuclease